MESDRLSELLRSLPRAKASETFTTRVIGVARSRSRTRPRAFLLRAVTAMLAIAVIGGVAGAQLVRHRAEEARLAAARTEQQRLERELESLKDLTTSSEPVLYVGSSADTDYFIDLRALQEASAVTDQPAVRTANYQPGL